DKDYTAAAGKDIKTPDGAQQGVKAEYFANKKLEGAPATTRIEEKIDLDTVNKPPDPVIPKGAFSARWSASVTPSVSGSYKFALNVEGGAKLFFDGKLLAEKQLVKTKGFKAGRAFDVIKTAGGKQERLSAEVDLDAGKTYQLSVEYVYGGDNAVCRLEWLTPSLEKKKAVEDGLEVARKSDVAIVFLGIGLDQEREGIDRADLNLPQDQEDYMRRLLAVNPNTIAVLINGSPLSINWIDENVPAIVDAWYPGEQGGNALADVLFGDYNPAGRLPVTFYSSVDQLPPFDDYEVSKGRTYMYLQSKPLYPFGYGLSFTKFDYSGLKIDKDRAYENQTVKVSLKVGNTGARDGDEVVQLYVRKTDSHAKRPTKQLKGFKRITLKKGASAQLAIELKVADLAFWSDADKKFVVEPGKYEIMVGASSNDIRLKTTLEVVK
ncbi:MAG TPA: glycoside hydrolase family 3 C-terminal domain-containing protein, partial [bacterium]|nr:glycoside hydrolase family 3 C-terminal domain-containing protein [bacterium]